MAIVYSYNDPQKQFSIVDKGQQLNQNLLLNVYLFWNYSYILQPSTCSLVLIQKNIVTNKQAFIYA